MAIQSVREQNKSNLESRYGDLLIYETDTGVKYFEVCKKKTFRISDDDVFYSVEARYSRIDMIANKYYNNCKLMWVIIIANSIKNPFNIPVGTILRIPSLANIFNGV